jgi:periplasmic protein TonB
VVVEPAPLPPEPVGALSYAKTPREYRRDAAAHLYGLNSDRIFKGRMPPLLYAVGTLEVDLDPRGMVTKTSWMRAPKHAPEVMADIERSVRAAAPYPVAVNLGHVTYTDTWLWHKSGRFQLDTLTEGQDAKAPEPDAGMPRAKATASKKTATKVVADTCTKTKTNRC